MCSLCVRRCFLQIIQKPTGDKIKMLKSAAEAAAKVDPNNMPKLLHFNKLAQGAIEEVKTDSFD